MRRSAFVLLLAACALVLAAGPSDAGGWHGRVFIGVGPGFWWGPAYPFYWYPPVYYPPPPVVADEPPVFIQRQSAAPVPPPPPPSGDWYYCESSRAYYPNVQSCPEEWVKVPARPH